MFLKFNALHLCLFAFCVHLKCVSTLVDPADHIEGKEVNKGETGKPETVPNKTSVDTFKVSKKTDKIIAIPLDKPGNGMNHFENKGNPRPTTLEGASHLVLEGGVIIDLTSTAPPTNGLLNIETADESITHSKGSKPRKGVQHPGSSIVPRKGVDPLGATIKQSDSEVTSDPPKESSNINDKEMLLNKTDLPNIKTDQQEHKEQATNKIIPHKPAMVTDSEDVDDFEKYPIIQTSTTGEDYIIIGIVIVLGIWCSIFGALIFYRRAGEYWDRRHYRRMDFLVEGMYND